MREIRVCSVQPLSMAHLAPFEGELDRERACQKMEGNIDLACRLLAQAGRSGCDLVCYPEDVQGIAHYGYYLDDIEMFTGLVEMVPGPTTERISEVARQHEMHVVFGIFEKEIRSPSACKSPDVLKKSQEIRASASCSWPSRGSFGRRPCPAC